MNELLCPGCGEKICDFVTYCPNCGFSLKAYEEQQKAEYTAAYFADILPVPAQKPQERTQKQKAEQRPKRSLKKALLVSAVVLIFLTAVSILSLTIKDVGKVPSLRKPELLSEEHKGTARYFEYTFQSESRSPFVAVYDTSDTNVCCVYMENGEGNYTGDTKPLQLIGYLETDCSVHMKSINTTYQYYVLDSYFNENGEKLCIVDFDITFDQPVNGLFLYDLQYNYDGIRCKSQSVAVMNGHTRIAYPVWNLPQAIALEAHLTPRCFVNTNSSVLHTGELLWGSEVDFRLADSRGFSTEMEKGVDFSSASCSKAYPVEDALRDGQECLILYRYTVESGGSNFELGKSTYYHLSVGKESTQTLPHYQNFYGDPVTMPNYSLDVIGYLPLQKFD